MNNNTSSRIGNLLGLARRGGQLTTGFTAVVGLIKDDKKATVLIAADLSKKTEKELRYALREYDFETVRLPINKDEIGRALGFEKPVGVIGTDDKGFSKAVKALCCQNERDSKEE